MKTLLGYERMPGPLARIGALADGRSLFLPIKKAIVNSWVSRWTVLGWYLLQMNLNSALEIHL